MKKIRLFIVDDSLAVVNLIEKIVFGSDKITIIGKANTGRDALKRIPELKPDVVTLDYELPDINGVEVLKTLMRTNPVPVLMFSSFTYEGSKVTNEALVEGAIDFMFKPAIYSSLYELKKEFIEKITTIAGVKTIRRISHMPASKKQKTQLHKDSRKEEKKAPDGRGHTRLIVIGVSTGGPFTLKTMIMKLDENWHHPIAIAQHMPPNFTKVLAEELGRFTRLKVKEVEHGEEIAGSTIYIGQGGRNFGITEEHKFRVWDDSASALPSVDALFSSTAKVMKEDLIGIVLTGMGKDGLIGAQKIKEQGGIVIAESSKSALIYGMPRAVIEAGFADEIDEVGKIPGILDKYVD